jgi:hypothetical protein
MLAALHCRAYPGTGIGATLAILAVTRAQLAHALLLRGHQPGQRRLGRGLGRLRRGLCWQLRGRLGQRRLGRGLGRLRRGLCWQLRGRLGQRRCGLCGLCGRCGRCGRHGLCWLCRGLCVRLVLVPERVLDAAAERAVVAVAQAQAQLAQVQGQEQVAERALGLVQDRVERLDLAVHDLGLGLGLGGLVAGPRRRGHGLGARCLGRVRALGRADQIAQRIAPAGQRIALASHRLGRHLVGHALRLLGPRLRGLARLAPALDLRARLAQRRPGAIARGHQGCARLALPGPRLGRLDVAIERALPALPAFGHDVEIRPPGQPGACDACARFLAIHLGREPGARGLGLARALRGVSPRALGLCCGLCRERHLCVQALGLAQRGLGRHARGARQSERGLGLLGRQPGRLLGRAAGLGQTLARAQIRGHLGPGLLAALHVRDRGLQPERPLQRRVLGAQPGRVGPRLLGLRQRRRRRRLVASQLVAAPVPAHRGLGGLQRGLGGLQRVRGRARVRLQARACVIIEHHPAGDELLQPLELLRLALVPLERCLGELAVDLGAGHALQQLAAGALVRAQERGKVALRQQRRAPELVEAQAQTVLELLQHLGLGAAQDLARGDVFQPHLLRLQPAIGPAPGPPDVPARAVDPLIAPDEVHLRVPRGAAVAQDPAHVVGRQAVFLVRAADRHAAAIIEARRGVEERHAQRVEQRALARAGGAGDREQPGLGQRRLIQLDRERTLEAGQVAAADGDDPHASASGAGLASPWRPARTSARSSSNASTSSCAGSPSWSRL